jgi:hypothetical protein
VQQRDAITNMKKRNRYRSNLIRVYNRAGFLKRFRFKFGSCTLSA